jgi:ferredoxin-NADP reductase
MLDVPGWLQHVAGQHVDIRLTAANGYQATRSYSLSSGPDEPPQITVERVDEGEVSPYLVDIAMPGDQLEVRGPLGGYFVWEPRDLPLVLIGGGSGVAPLRAMWRAGGDPIRVLYSARTADRVIFAEELAANQWLEATVHLTREDRSEYVSGRIDRTAVAAALDGLTGPTVYICGPTDFVESVARDASELLGSGHPIRTERFG